MPDALCQRASHSSGTTSEVDRFVLRLRLRCVDDERDDAVSMEFWSGGEANRLPTELISDRAFVRLGVFSGHRSFRSRKLGECLSLNEAASDSCVREAIFNHTAPPVGDGIADMRLAEEALEVRVWYDEKTRHIKLAGKGLTASTVSNDPDSVRYHPQPIGQAIQGSP